MGNKGSLFFIPSIIADDVQLVTIPVQVKNVLPKIRYFLAEDIRTARRFLSSLKVYDSIEVLNFSVLDKNTSEDLLDELLKPLLEGENMGVLSEAGCPGIADPGALAAKFAHEHNIRVVPLTGPSSITLALMASGLDGQKFAFHGYLPIDQREAGKAIKNYEKESRSKGQTQIFIETPYRNNALFQNLIQNLDSNTALTIAVDLTGGSESVVTKSVKDWKTQKPDLPKSPAIFLFLA